MPSISPDRIEGLLLGTAVGDALGLPSEGMKPKTIERRGWTKKWKHRFIFGRGMWSDDTEHTIMLAQALLASEGDVKKFTCKFAWELRWWLFGLPAGVGMATARAMFKLWLGFPPNRSGVFSAGNGSAMRTAIISAYFSDDSRKRRLFVEAQTRITHTDPKALTASLAITEIAVTLLKSDEPPSQDIILKILEEANQQVSPHRSKDWEKITFAMKNGWEQNSTLPDFLVSIGSNPNRGISGYAYHTVPAVIYAGVKFQWDYRQVITSTIKAGGDTDTTAAIAGALCGAYGGKTSIPYNWIAHISEWPTSTQKLQVLAHAIHNHTPLRIRPHWSLMLLFRNILFLLVVLFHGFTRLLPIKSKLAK